MNQRVNGQDTGRDAVAKMGLGMVVGMALGFGVGLALDSIAIGAGIGAALAVSLGIAFSGRRREPSKPLTIASVVFLFVGIVVLAMIMHLVQPHWWCDYPVLNLIPGC